jgi:hypothetical protein
MDQAIRNKLRNVVTQCRKLLEEAVAQVLQGQFAIYPTGKKDEVHVEDESHMTNLVEEEDRACRRDLLDHFGHIQALGYKPKDALAQLVREIAFTHLNRLCAYKMMEARGVVVGGRPFREAVSRGVKSQGFLFYLAEHPDDEQRYNSGHQDVAYRHFLDWLGGALSEEIGVLFSPNDPANRLYPPQRVLDQVLDLINTGDIKPEETELQEAWPKIWPADETIGWVYQYFTPKELRDQARKESAAPRNSYELAFRNQFFTPRYVVEFLTDNTLGRIWYEMRKGQTTLTDQCRYMVRRPNEVFLAEGTPLPSPSGKGAVGEGEGEDLSQEELLKLPVFIPHRPKKDPREIKVLDPACGSGHFLLYCFDLLETIYEEAYDDPDLGPALKNDYPTQDDLRRAVPGLILAHNLHGIDIDRRATQIAALALWLRCHRAYQEREITKDRPRIARSNIVCAEPMPGEKEMLKEFVADVQPRVLGHLVEVVFDKMQLAGEAGSLLKVEDELREAIAVAKRQWAAEYEQAVDRKGRTLLFSRADIERAKNRAPQSQLFDLSEITEEQFWNEAESRVLQTLRDYASHATNGGRLRRQLFAEDSAHGFAFVDVWQKRFDVVLMNPPFGESCKRCDQYIASAYRLTKNDLYAAFVERGLLALGHGGRLGAITSRTGFFLSSFQKWREDILLRNARPTVFADLGYGVLDSAMVETAAYCLEAAARSSHAVFFRLLSTDDKAHGLGDAIGCCPNQPAAETMYLVNCNSLRDIPGSPFAYWIDKQLRSLFSRFPRFESAERQARRGASTGDDTRRVRCWWEVRPDAIGRSRRWVPFAKGGAYSPFYADIHLLVGWDELRRTFEGFYGRTGRMIERPEALDFFFRSGLTWPRRSTSGFGIRVLPAGCVIADKGPAVFVKDGSELAILGMLFSQTYQRLVEVSLAAGEETQSGTASRSYEVGVIQNLPWPPLSQTDREQIAGLVSAIVNSVRARSTNDETARWFVRPIMSPEGGFEEAANQWQRATESEDVRLLEDIAEIEQRVDDILGLTPKLVEDLSSGDARRLTSLPRKELDADFDTTYRQSIHETIRDELDEEGGNRQIAVKSYYLSRHLEVLAQTLKTAPSQIARLASERRLLPEGLLRDAAECGISYAVGCIFGRWDIRYAAGQQQSPVFADLFAPLPVCSPGTLQGSDGLPLSRVPERYPIRISWDGIVVDDPEHQDHIVRRCREALELVWGRRGEAAEREACEILGVKGLREYFRKPNSGGFWRDHVSRYSRSRRKAPTYWLLQSSKKNYALWLYYHRLDKDLLFKALVNYVEPKIRLEENRLDSFRAQKSAGGKTPKKLDKDIEKQEDFLSELRDFEDRLRRAANLHLEPDLNDGVVLNIAPLWELVPWREAKDYWEELLEGKYEWSSIGKQLREKGLVKC